MLVGSSDTLVVEDLRWSWLTTTGEEEWVPATDLDGVDRIFFQLDSPYTEKKLRICARQPVDVWVDRQLLLQTKSSGCRFLDLDSLAGPGHPGTLKFTIVAGEELKGLSTELIAVTEIERDEAHLLVEKRDTFFSDFYIMSALVILLLLGILKVTYPQKFSQLTRNPFSAKFTTSDMEDSYSAFFSFDNLFSIFLFGLLVSANLIYLSAKLPLPIPLGSSFPHMVMHWVWLGVVLAFIVALKYIFSSIISILFQVRSLPNIQVQDFVYLLTMVSLAAAAFIAVDFSFLRKDDLSLVQTVFVLTVIFIIIFQIWFYLKCVKLYSRKKLLIISYLCTTEIVPGFLAIYWFLK